MSNYRRVTEDLYDIEQFCNPGEGWEVVCAEKSLKEARIRKKEYEANQPQYPVRLAKKRVPLSRH